MPELWDIAPLDRKAAVLIIVFRYVNSDVDQVLLTKRSSKLRNYPGDAALPGGRAEIGESCWKTALREAEEETGFNLADFNVQMVNGKELPYMSRNNLVVYSCLLRITNPIESITTIAPHLQTQEVEKVFSVPLQRFLQPPDVVRMVPFGTRQWYFYSFDVPDETPVIGLTAHILVDAARAVYNKMELSFPALKQLGFEQACLEFLTSKDKDTAWR